nr:unnamed protein product [Callosobruchus analis]
MSERTRRILALAKGVKDIQADQQGIQISDIRNSSFLMINKYKKSICKFCEDKVVSKHFARHLERNHSNEREVREIFSCKSGSIERKRLLAILRNEGQLQSGVHGELSQKSVLEVMMKYVLMNTLYVFTVKDSISVFI